MTKNDFLGFLHAGDFKQLFLECGWNNPTTTDAYPIPVGEETYSVSEVAQKGLKIYVCKVAKMPEASVRRQLDSKLRKLSHDYFLIFVSTAEEFHHLWSVPVKSVDKRQLVTIEYVQDDQAAFLLENTDQNVDRIANAVGYENMGYFHRIFKEAFGVSPRNYRLQIR